MLQEAYHNRSLSLYAKLGFEIREPISTMQGPPVHAAFPHVMVRPATQNDVDACNSLCSRVHGHDRRGELLDSLKQGSARVVEREGRVTGYTTLIGFFGHSVGETNDDLKALISEASQ